LGNGPHNIAVLRHMALNVMQKETTKPQCSRRWPGVLLTEADPVIVPAVGTPISGRNVVMG
jgi:hypothetical protein